MSEQKKAPKTHVQLETDPGKFIERVVRDIVIEDRVQISMGMVEAAKQVANFDGKDPVEFEERYPGLTLEQAKQHGQAILSFSMLFALKLAHKPLPVITASTEKLTPEMIEETIAAAIKAHESGTCGCGQHDPRPEFPGKKKAAETIH